MRRSVVHERCRAGIGADKGPGEPCATCPVRTADGLCGIDRDQRIVFWNASAENLLGFAFTEVRGRYCFDVFRAVDEIGCRVCKHRCPAFDGAARTELPATRDICSHTKSGKAIWLSVSTIVVSQPSLPNVALMHLFRDVSRVKALEHGVSQLLTDMHKAKPQTDASGASVEPTPMAQGPLTAREQEVLSLLASGSSTQSIADTLVVSTATVRHHVNHILAKLGAHSRLDAVTLALRQKLL